MRSAGRKEVILFEAFEHSQGFLKQDPTFLCHDALPSPVFLAFQYHGMTAQEKPFHITTGNIQIVRSAHQVLKIAEIDNILWIKIRLEQGMKNFNLISEPFHLHPQFMKFLLILRTLHKREPGKTPLEILLEKGADNREGKILFNQQAMFLFNTERKPFPAKDLFHEGFGLGDLDRTNPIIEAIMFPGDLLFYPPGERF